MYSWLGGVLRCNSFSPGATGATLVPSPSSMPEHTEDPDWDTTTVVREDFLKIPLERRHSGWESVEKKWAEKKQPPPQQPPSCALKSRSDLAKAARAAMEHFPYPHMSIPTPQIEFSFRMRIILSPKTASISVNDGFKKLTTVADGMWSGHLGHGLVISGGQESQDMASGKDVTTQVEAFYRLQTGDEPPAYIECKARGCKTGPAEVMKALEQIEEPAQVDPRLCQYRIFITMKTSDERYADKLNSGMWIGSCLWKGLEVVYDAYRMS
ncbi:hypothetical protein GGR52DRAFT_427796 [Hypoxylon sp. FL1284]|nr:hypothetical protein GGR52DRAFT_427796 [Hypoxylon sp. FL1284]